MLDSKVGQLPQSNAYEYNKFIEKLMDASGLSRDEVMKLDLPTAGKYLAEALEDAIDIAAARKALQEIDEFGTIPFDVLK